MDVKSRKWRELNMNWIMKNTYTLSTLVVALFVSATVIASQKVSGVVEASNQVVKDMPDTAVLFVFARAHGVKSGPPAAVLRIPNPKFPVQFTLGPENAMMPGIPFEGPFDLTARLSPTGDAMEKSKAVEAHIQRVGSDAKAVVIKLVK